MRLNTNHAGMKPQSPAPNSGVTVCGSAEDTKMICIVGCQEEGGAGDGTDAVTLAPDLVLHPKVDPGDKSLDLPQSLDSTWEGC